MIDFVATQMIGLSAWSPQCCLWAAGNGASSVPACSAELLNDSRLDFIIMVVIASPVCSIGPLFVFLGGGLYHSDRGTGGYKLW